MEGAPPFARQKRVREEITNEQRLFGWRRDRYGGFNVGRIGPIDRTKDCPFLLRCFILDHAPKPEEFVARLPAEVHIYTYRDVNLGELCELLKKVDKRASKRGAVLDFFLAYPTPGKETEMTISSVGAASSFALQSKTDSVAFKPTKRLMNDAKFEIGDFLVVHVLP